MAISSAAPSSLIRTTSSTAVIKKAEPAKSSAVESAAAESPPAEVDESSSAPPAKDLLASLGSDEVEARADRSLRSKRRKTTEGGGPGFAETRKAVGELIARAQVTPDMRGQLESGRSGAALVPTEAHRELVHAVDTDPVANPHIADLLGSQAHPMARQAVNVAGPSAKDNELHNKVNRDFMKLYPKAKMASEAEQKWYQGTMCWAPYKDAPKLRDLRKDMVRSLTGALGGDSKKASSYVDDLLFKAGYPIALVPANQRKAAYETVVNNLGHFNVATYKLGKNAGSRGLTKAKFTELRDHIFKNPSHKVSSGERDAYIKVYSDPRFMRLSSTQRQGVLGDICKGLRGSKLEARLRAELKKAPSAAKPDSGAGAKPTGSAVSAASKKVSQKPVSTIPAGSGNAAAYSRGVRDRGVRQQVEGLATRLKMTAEQRNKLAGVLGKGAFARLDPSLQKEILETAAANKLGADETTAAIEKMSSYMLSQGQLALATQGSPSELKRAGLRGSSTVKKFIASDHKAALDKIAKAKGKDPDNMVRRSRVLAKAVNTNIALAQASRKIDDLNGVATMVKDPVNGGEKVYRQSFIHRSGQQASFERQLRGITDFGKTEKQLKGLEDGIEQNHKMVMSKQGEAIVKAEAKIVTRLSNGKISGDSAVAVWREAQKLGGVKTKAGRALIRSLTMNVPDPKLRKDLHKLMDASGAVDKASMVLGGFGIATPVPVIALNFIISAAASDTMKADVKAQRSTLREKTADYYGMLLAMRSIAKPGSSLRINAQDTRKTNVLDDSKFESRVKAAQERWKKKIMGMGSDQAERYCKAFLKVAPQVLMGKAYNKDKTYDAYSIYRSFLELNKVKEKDQKLAGVKIPKPSVPLPTSIPSRVSTVIGVAQDIHGGGKRD